MGFSLKKIASVAVNPVASVTGGGVLRALGDLTKAESPNLPGVPNPNLYSDVPDFTPEELQYIQQRRQLLDQYSQKLNAAPTGYDTTNDQIAQAEQAKYLAALNQQQGQLSVAQQQARQAEFEKFKEAAGRRGIRILGDDPSTSTSNSTAGIQLLSEFNKRYDSLADQQRQADLSFGYNANTGRLGLINQQKQNYFGNNLALNDAYGGIQDIYGNQRAAKYNVANANTDVRNQFLTNTYNRDSQQALLNANAKNQTRSNRLGLVNSAIGAGASILSGGLAGRTGAQSQMGFMPYQTGGVPGPYSYGS